MSDRFSVPGAKAAARVCFFHQNDVFGVQGGIERYIATLLETAGDGAALAGPTPSESIPHAIEIIARGPVRGPRWLRYILGVAAQRREVAAALRANNARVLEFSRPEYGLVGWLFPGKRVFTIHGTGPGPDHRLHRVVHDACCLLLPLIADRVQVIGRDPSGLPRLARWMLGARVVYVDAWHAECFTSAPLPPLAEDRPMRVFYAGRLASQKNPALLFEIIRQARARAPGAFEFHYFGSDYEGFAQAGLSEAVENHGLLGPPELARAIASCHLGVLCSGYGEGSPYIIAESLACGRPFVVSSLPTLVASYHGFPGIYFVGNYGAPDFVAQMLRAREDLRAGRLTPETIAGAVTMRAQSRAAPALLAALAGVADDASC